jgi:hypothetical protein
VKVRVVLCINPAQDVRSTRSWFANCPSHLIRVQKAIILFRHLEPPVNSQGESSWVVPPLPAKTDDNTVRCIVYMVLQFKISPSYCVKIVRTS